MFASKRPRDLTSHAAAKLCARCEAEFQEGGVYSEDEHRDYHQPAQHNEPNPILVKLREQQPDWNHPYAEVNAFDNANGAAWEVAGEPDDAPFGPWWRYENHAYRIISRIANLSQIGA